MPNGEMTHVSKMLMLFLITAVPVEMAHEIKHLPLLSPHYGWSTVLQAARERGSGGENGQGVLSYGDDPAAP